MTVASFKTCPKCAEDIRALAVKCRFCGYEYPENSVEPEAPVTVEETAPKMTKTVLVGIVAFVLLVVYAFSQTAKPGSSAGPDFAAAPDVVAAPDAAVAPEPDKSSGWSYDTITDDLTGKSGKIASVRSLEPVELGFPYNGGTYARLNVRSHPQFGTDIFVVMNPAQTNCNSIDRCTMKVSIDGKVENFEVSPPDSNAIDTLFVIRDQVLLGKLKKGKKLVIQAPIYQHGEVQWTFDISGLEWPPKS